MKLSVIIIAKDAEDWIADAIASVNFANEVIVVDNNSTDRTIDVAKYLKAKVINSKSVDFSELRNRGLKEASGEWILYIDSDERVTEELKRSIQSKIEYHESEIAGYKVKRKNFYFGNYEWPYIEKLERIFRKDKLKGWYGKLHESPTFDGETGELDGFLLHHTHRDLTYMLAKTIIWSKVEAKLRFEARHPHMSWWRFFRVMVTAFFDSYIRQGGWKVGVVGLIESLYQSFSIFVTYARLWEMQQRKRK